MTSLKLDHFDRDTLSEYAEFYAHSGVYAFQMTDERWEQLGCPQNVTVPSTGRVIPIRGGGVGNYIKPIYTDRESGFCPGSSRPGSATGTDAGGRLAANRDGEGGGE